MYTVQGHARFNRFCSLQSGLLKRKVLAALGRKEETTGKRPVESLLRPGFEFLYSIDSFASSGRILEGRVC